MESDSVVMLSPPPTKHFYESPRLSIAKPLMSHRFKCNCDPSPEPYGCAKAYRWLSIVNKTATVAFDHKKNRQVYLNLLGIAANISGSELQIKLDISRTFPKQEIFETREGEG